jgi:hypothetical protein
MSRRYAPGACLGVGKARDAVVRDWRDNHHDWRNLQCDEHFRTFAAAGEYHFGALRDSCATNATDHRSVLNAVSVNSNSMYRGSNPVSFRISRTWATKLSIATPLLKR